MKTPSKTIIRRESLITLDVEKRKLTLRVNLTDNTNIIENFSQDFNLDVIPYEMAMSVICTLINPQKK